MLAVLGVAVRAQKKALADLAFERQLAVAPPRELVWIGRRLATTL